MRHGGDYPERGVCAVCLALLEIAGIDRHPVGDMSEAEDRLVTRAGKGIERGRFHFDREDVAGVGPLDRRLGFAERRIGGPGGALANRTGNPALASEFESNIALYESRRPLRDPSITNGGSSSYSE